MKKLVVLSGAGISAESGLKTFRGSDGLWNGYNIYDVATPEAWKKDFRLVLDFYNMRRREIEKAVPNEGHLALVQLETCYDVEIVTQNIDDLHERAGSSKIVHLHGEIVYARSTTTGKLYYLGFDDLSEGMLCEKGSQLRPHIVWFGEPVPLIEKAAQKVSEADIVIVTGTSLQVYPAAGLIQYIKNSAELYLVDPELPGTYIHCDYTHIQKTAANGLPKLVKELIAQLK